MVRSSGLAADRDATVGSSVCSRWWSGRGMNRMISAPTKVPPTPRSRPGPALDCFAGPVIGRRVAPTRWPAMTSSNVRHARFRDHFRREPYPYAGPLRTWTLSHARADTFARAADKGSDGSALETLRRRCLGRMWRLECGHRPIQSVRLKKPATGFPARAKSCDVEYMPVICPTCQIFWCGLILNFCGGPDRRRRSRII